MLVAGLFWLAAGTILGILKRRDQPPVGVRVAVNGREALQRLVCQCRHSLRGQRRRRCALQLRRSRPTVSGPSYGVLPSLAFQLDERVTACQLPAQPA